MNVTTFVKHMKVVLFSMKYHVETKIIIMKRNLNVVLISSLVLLASCHGNETKEKVETKLEQYSKIYDFSGVDMTGVNILAEFSKPGKYVDEAYCFLLGEIIPDEQHQDDKFLWIGVFDERTKKPVYIYGDYDAPKAYIVYGERCVPKRQLMNIVMLEDYLLLYMQYQDKDIYTLELIKLDLYGEVKRIRIKETSDFFLIDNGYYGMRKWGDNSILITVQEELNCYRELIYDIDKNNQIYCFDFTIVNIGLSLSHKIINDYFIVSDTDNLDWGIISLGQYCTINLYQGNEHEKSERYCRIFENINMNIEYPDYVMVNRINSIGGSVATYKVTRMTYGREEKETKIVIVSYKDGEINVEVLPSVQ